MIEYSEQKTVQAFLTNEFSRVSAKVAKEICEHARVLPNTKLKNVGREQAENLIKGINKTKIMAPPTDCLSPLGEDQILKGLKKEINAEYFCAVSRKPAVYRGNPFVIECGIAYGGHIDKEGTIDIMRFANRVPLLYQQGACAFTKSIQEVSWRSYGLSQSGNNIPTGPAIVMIHIASVWVPFTSEAKEALAHYPDIIAEIKLALQECGRKLAKYTAKKRRVSDELKKRSYIERYMPHLAVALSELLELPKAEEKAVIEHLKKILERKRGELDDIDFDPEKNTDYDEDFANIGKEDENDEEEE
jgi:DNA topoisomerase-6 subunit B